MQKIGNLQTTRYRAPEIEDWNRINTASNKPSTGVGPNHVITDLSVTSDARARVGTASDIWSIGCVLAEMFLGKRLLTDDSQRTSQVSEFHFFSEMLK